MQKAEITEIKLLVPRKTQASLQNAAKSTFITNYFEIELKHSSDLLVQYSFSCEPEIVDDSLQMIRKVIQTIKNQLKDQIGYINQKGYMLWGYKGIKGTLLIKSKFQLKGQSHCFKVLIKEANRYSLSDLQKYPQQKAKLIQFMNLKLQKKLRQKGYIEAGRGKYFHKDQYLHNTIKQLGISVNRGFKFTLTEIKQRIYLKIDSCSRILQLKSFLESIKSTRQQNWDSFKGVFIITNYGNSKTYQIQKIQNKLNPLSTFECQGVPLSYRDYYKKQYGVTINDLKQPLILTKQTNKKQQKPVKDKSCYLVPELVSLVGIPQNLGNNNFANRQISKYTKLQATEKMDEIYQSLKLFNNVSQDDLEFKVGKQLVCNGNILNQPTILLANNKKAQLKNGIMNLRSQIMNPANFQNWLFVYAVGNNQKSDDREADQVVDALKQASKIFKIKFTQPGFLAVKSKNFQDYKSKISQDIKQCGLPRIIVFYDNGMLTKLYDELKVYCTDLQIPSQVIKKKSILDNPKRTLSVASKIILQMNVKVGSSLWEVKRNHAYFKNKSVIYGGISTSKNSKSYTLGFVGTKSDSNKIHCEYETNIRKKQQIQFKTYENIFSNWLNSYSKINKNTLPDIIILYRQGLSQIQIKQQVNIQIQAFHSALKKISQNSKSKLVYIVANRKVDSRIFSKENNKVSNPTSGTIIIQDFCSGKQSDFYLVPQQVTQGTATPTQFIIAYDQAQIPLDAIAQFTFQECFNYFNWQGAVRVPACLQYADKLANFMGQHIKKNISISQIQNSAFFL